MAGQEADGARQSLYISEASDAGLFLDIGVSAKVMAWVGEDLKQCPGITYSW